MRRLDDPDAVRTQYDSTERLQTRIAVWHPDAAGRTPQDVALAAVAETRPHRVLEVGCGTGRFAARCIDELRCDVVAIDSSPAMVDAAQGIGVDAAVADVQRLPFADGEFDCVVAAWMLYHVERLGDALAELARVIRPDGRLVAVTNGDWHLADLWHLVGAERPTSTFTSQKGAAHLLEHFASVERRDVNARAVFETADAVRAYLASLEEHEAATRVPELDEPFVAEGESTVFVATKAG